MTTIIIVRTEANISLNIYYVPGIVQRALHGLTHLIESSQHPINPISKMRKQRSQEPKEPTQGLRTNEGESQIPMEWGLIGELCALASPSDLLQPRPVTPPPSTYLLQEAFPDHTSPPGSVPRLNPQPCDFHICSQLGRVYISLPGCETLVGRSKPVRGL